MLVASGFQTSSTFPADFKEQVRSRTDLVRLVGETVSLTPKGPHDYVGLCPFHDDHNPSFHVYPDRQAYRCWVCDEGGDCFSFVMKTEKLGFREALEQLAERANIPMPQVYGAKKPEEKNRQQKLLEILAWAEQRMHQCLVSENIADGARKYLAGRGISRESIKNFRLGYHPESWTWLLDQAGSLKFSAGDLFQARLVRERKGGGYYDDFVGRLMFPIRDMRGRPVAFGARVLPEAERQDPKYLNSPESEFFTKSRMLYGFEQARETIRTAETVVVMEGNTDVILAHQHGMMNAVATLGTSLTEAHVAFLKRFARKVVLVFDGDEAGQKAAGRSIEKFLAQEVDLRILTLPGGLDPADYLGKFGLESFQKLVEESTEAWEHKFQLAVKEIGVDSVDARQRVLDEMLELIARTPNFTGSPRETVLVSRLSGRLLMDERAVRQQLSEKRKRSVQNASGKPASKMPAARSFDLKKPGDLVEAEVLEILLMRPELVETLAVRIRPEQFHNPVLKSLLQLAFDMWERDERPAFDKLMAELEDPAHKQALMRIDDLARQKKIAQKLISDKTTGDAEGSMEYLEEVVRRLLLSNERRQFESLKGSLVETPAKPSATDGAKPAGELHQEHLRYLLEAQKFHAKRANS